MTAIVINIAGDYDGRDIEKARKSLGKLGEAANNNAFTDLGKKLKTIGDGMTKVGKKMSTHVTLPLVAIGAASVIAFNEVDEGLYTVAARSGATGKALTGLQDTFKAVARTATQDMVTVGETVGTLAGKFELTGKPLERLSSNMLTLARVTGTDVKTTTDAASKAITAFGLDAAKSSGFLDTLLVASQKSGVGIDQLAQIAATAAPTFQTYGIGAKDSLGLISALAGAGIPATKVVGGLNTAFKNLTKEGVKDLPAGLQAVFEKIRDAKNPTAATATAVEVFGSRVGVTLASAIRNGTVSIEDLGAALDGSAGALGRTAEAVEGPQEKFARLINQLKLVGASFVEAVLPAIEAVIPYIQKAVDWFMQLDPSIKTIIVVVGVLAAAIGPLLVVLGGVVTALGTIIAAIGAISAPVLIAVAAIAAIVAIIVLLWTKSEGFRNAVMAVWDTIKQAIAAAINSIKAKLDENREKLQMLQEWFGKVWGFVEKTVFPIIALLVGSYLKGMITTIGFVIGKLIDVIGWFVTFAVKIGEIIGKIAEFVTVVKNKVGDAISFIGELPGKVLGFFKNAGTLLVDVGKDMIQGLLDGAGSLLGKIGEFFLDKLPGWIVGPFKAALGIASPSKVFEGFGKNLGEGLRKGVDGERSKTAQSAARLAREIASMSKAALDKALDKATTSKDAAQDRLQRLQDFFTRARAIVVDGFTQLKDKAQSRIDDFQGKLDGLVDDARQFATNLRDAFSVAFSATGEGSVLDRFRQGIKDGQAFVQQVQRLREFGLNETSLQNIISAGVEQGKQIADSLLAEGPGAIGEVNTLQSAFESQVAGLANMMSQEKFGAQIVQAQAALDQAQAAYAAIAAREVQQLAALDALGKQFGLETDAMTALLDAGQARIEEILSNEETATTVLAEAVSEVTTGLLDTATQMAKKAAALQRTITNLETRIAAISSRINDLNAKKPDGRATGGPVDAGTPYFVGERGVELFVPRVSGAIVNNRDLQSMGGGGSQIVIEKGALQLSISGAENAQQVESLVQQQFDALVAELARELNR